MLKAEIIGNLGADAEIKRGEGYSFVSMRIANTEKWKDENDQEHTETQWVDVNWSKTDSPLIPFLKSGVKVFVRGFVRTRVYSSKQDRKMKAGLTINALEIELCGGSFDVVPRQLIIPESGDIVDVAKYYQANVDTKAWKKDDQGVLLDRQGNQYQLIKGGWVTPLKVEEEPVENQAKDDAQ